MLQKVSSVFQEYYQLRLNGIHKFKSKVEIFAEVGPYVVRTVNTFDDLRKAFALRWEVFHHELQGKGKYGIDIDHFDFDCDHLVIEEKKTGKIVGTYRINCSLFTKEFYSSQEFNLKNILGIQGVKIELGRACIHKDYRRGLVISLLWRGIAKYMAATGAEILFGCASIQITSPRQAALLYRYFSNNGRFTPIYQSSPTPNFQMPYLDLWIQNFRGDLTASENEEVEKLIPPLCRAYLKIGAYLGGEPAWDKEYKCIDFLTILQSEDLNRTLWKKYKLDSELSIDSISSPTMLPVS